MFARKKGKRRKKSGEEKGIGNCSHVGDAGRLLILASLRPLI
jgi:hypothetical protein